MTREIYCTFCHMEEPNYKAPHGDIEITCSRCTQRLVNASQEQLLKAYYLAVKEGTVGNVRNASVGREMGEMLTRAKYVNMS